MAKEARKQQPIPARLANRPGEGNVSLDIKVDTTVGIDGKTVTYMGVDLAKAPVPDRKFTADTCAVIDSAYTLKLVFGQERIDGKGLRSAIVVQMGRGSGGNFVRICDSMANPSIAEIAQLDGIPSEKLSPAGEEPPQALTLSANMPLAGISGQEACIDFYQASPFAMGIAVRSDKLSLESVVRVDLRTSLFFGLLDDLRGRLAKELSVGVGGKK